MAWQSKWLFIPPLRNTVIKWKRADLSWKCQLAKTRCRFFCKCVQVHWHKSPVPSLRCWVHALLLVHKVCTLEGVTGGIRRNTLLVFYCILFFMLLFHQVTGITFYGMPYSALFSLLFFLSLFWFGFGFFLTDLFLGKSSVSWLAARVFVCVFRSFVWGLLANFPFNISLRFCSSSLEYSLIIWIKWRICNS